MSTTPHFTRLEIDLEKRQVEKLDSLLAVNGALSLDGIFKLLQKDEKNIFPLKTALNGFIQSRSNIFECNQSVSSLICNRSLEYREAIKYLVHNLNIPSSQPKNVRYVLTLLRKSHYEVLRREIGVDIESILRFISQHKSILMFEGLSSSTPEMRPVVLHPLAMKIPSVWVKEILPLHDQNYHYDRSITISSRAVVVISSKVTNYLKLSITRGPHAKDFVYVLGKNCALNHVDLAKKFPVNAQLNFKAFRAYYTAQPWTATEMTSIDDHSDSSASFSSSSSTEIVGKARISQHLSRNVAHAIAMDGNNEGQLIYISVSNLAQYSNDDNLEEMAPKNAIIRYHAIETNSNIRWKAIDISKAEPGKSDGSGKVDTVEKLVHTIDDHLNEHRLHISALWERLKPNLKGVCKDKEQLRQFLLDLPHLFLLSDGLVSKRSTEHRKVLLNLLGDFQLNRRFTLSSLSARLGSISADFKRDNYGCGFSSIANFIEDHDRLFHVHGRFDSKNPLAQEVRLRVKVELTGLDEDKILHPVVLKGRASVCEYNGQYGVAAIEDDDRKGQTILLSLTVLKNARNHGDLAIKMGMRLTFEAVYCANKNLAHPWKATWVLFDKCELKDQQLASPLKLDDEVFRITISNDRIPEMPSKIPQQDALLEKESNLKTMMDSFLDENPISLVVLFEKLVRTTQFSYQYQMLEFLHIRSNLFDLNIEKNTICRRSTVYRKAMSKLFVLCGKPYVTIDDIHRQITDNDENCFEILGDFASLTQFEEFLKEHEQIFELTELIDDKENRFIRLRGTFNSDYGLFLPRFYL